MLVDADLIAELRSIRKGRGLVAGRLSACPKLLSALRLEEPAAHELIVSTLRDMGDDLEVRALRNAYGIGMNSPGKLTTRRNDFAVSTGRHVDTIENYENATINELATRLLTAAASSTPIHRLRDPMLAPEDYELDASFILATFSFGYLAELEERHYYTHKRTNEDYLVTKLPQEKARTTRSTSFVAQATAHGRAFHIVLTFGVDRPAEMTMTRYPSVIAMTTGDGVEVAPTSVEDGPPGCTYVWENEVLPGVVYAAEWSY